MGYLCLVAREVSLQAALILWVKIYNKFLTMRTLIACALIVSSVLAWDPNCFKTLNRRFYDFNSLKRQVHISLRNSDDVYSQAFFEWNICTSVGDCDGKSSDSYVVQTQQCQSYGKKQNFDEMDGGIKITY